MADYSLQNADGLGWRFEKSSGSLSVLLEIAPASDADEKCGAQIKISGGLKAPPSAEKIEGLINALKENGLPEAGIEGFRLTPISWETFLANYA